MSLKELIENDLEDVFFEEAEFAEMHDLNGTVCIAVIEAISTKERSARTAENCEGMYKSILTLHVKAADLPEIPVNNEVIKVDGKIYIVNTCDNDIGMLTIGLAANRI